VEILQSAVAEEYTEALKQNKPILIFVKSLVESEEREQPLKEFLSSLSSDSPQHPSARVTYKTYRRISELREAVRESVSAEIAKIYKEPIYTVARDEMYELGAPIIRDAERRLYLFQRTPSLILSSRDYLADDSMKYAYEKTFEDVLQTWVCKNCGLADRKFLYLFSPEATRREIENKRLASNPAYLAEVRSRIERLTNIEVQSGYRFRVAMVDVPICGPLIVGDNRYAIWVLGADQAVSISQFNKAICDILVTMLNSYGQRHLSSDEIVSALGL